MPKTSTAFAAAICSGIALSSHAVAADKPLRGYYVGASGSYESYDVNVRSAALSADDLHLRGVNGGVFAGKNFDLSRSGAWIGGVEVSLTGNGADGSATAGADRIALASRYTYELAGRAGYTLAPDMLVYGRLGWARTKFDAGAGGKPTLDGVRFGGGVDKMIGKSTALRTEFTRTHYEAKRTDAGRIDPAQTQLTLGLSFFF
jgi:outer membrane immunogenic protein